MPLRQGSSDKVIQENIKCILDKDGCGYDPPYLDPARDEYTPAQAAAIAYAKAGRRNNVGKKTSASKKTKSVKTQEVKTPEGKKDEPKGDKSTSPAQSAKKEKETDTKNPANNIQVPDGWQVQQPGGDTNSSKKNQPPEGKTDNNVSPKEDKYEKLYQDNKDLLEKAYGGKNLDVKGGVWDVLDDKMKQYMLDVAPKIVAEKEKKQQQSQTTATPAPAKEQTPEPPAQSQQQPPPEPQTKPDVKTPDEWNWDPKKYEPQLQGNKLHFQGNTYTQSGTLPGSTAPKLYKDEDGNPKYVVKDNKGNEAQVNAEYVSNKVYNELSSYFPSMAATSKLADGKLVNMYIKDGKTLGDLSPKEMADLNVSSYMKKSLLADALLANWDFAGLYNDNIMVDKSGNLVRIDTGGTFNFKATGGSKSYNPLPMEIWSLKGSEQGSQFWGDASEDDYKQLWLDQTDQLGVNANGIRNIVNKSNLDDNLKATFNKRLQAMIIAGQEAHNFIKKGDPESWKALDDAMKMAFADTQAIDPNDPSWEKELRSNIQKRLGDLNPKVTQPSKFDPNNSNFGQNTYDRFVRDANNLLKSKLDGWEAFKDASDDEKYSIWSYTGGGYQDLNKYLRDGIYKDDDDPEYFETKAAALDSLFARLPSDDSLLHRMNTIRKSKGQAKIDQILNYSVGDIVETSGFDSYTQDQDGIVLDCFSKGSGAFHYITRYQGKNAKNVDAISATQGEQESVIPRKTRLRIAKIETIPVSTFPDLDPVSVGGSSVLMITYEDA